jgi:ribose transport system permease protein
MAVVHGHHWGAWHRRIGWRHQRPDHFAHPNSGLHRDPRHAGHRPRTFVHHRPQWRRHLRLPPTVIYLGQGRPLGIPTPVIILAVTALAAHYVLAYSRFGRHTLAMGDSENAARATGIPVERLRRKLYTISGMLAGLAGLVFMARVNSGDPVSGINYELAAITAAIIGGTSLFGGKGSILGALVGALIMGVLQNGLNLIGVQSYYQQVAIGAVLILAVWIDQLQSAKERKA